MDDELSVRVGRRVRIELVNDGGEVEEMALDIVPDEQADFASNLLGAGTALARALAGRKAGATIEYRQGDICRVKLLAVERSPKDLEHDAASRRQDVLDKALRAADRTNALNYASSFSSKWGDYDPEGIEDWE